MGTSAPPAARQAGPGTVKGVAPRRDFAAMEQRRMQAVDLFEQDAGLSKAEIGRRLGVSHQTVSDWHQVWRQGGRDALRAAGRAGRKPRLSAEQLEQVERVLENGPIANGYATDLWTLVRVGEVIERVTGVTYHPGHVWRILREQLGWTCRRAVRRAVERDDQAINEWSKTRWPKTRKGPGAGAAGTEPAPDRGCLTFSGYGAIRDERELEVWTAAPWIIDAEGTRRLVVDGPRR